MAPIKLQFAAHAVAGILLATLPVITQPALAKNAKIYRQAS